MNNDEQIINIVSQILKIDKREINLNTCANDIANWDSLAQINIILKLEENFNKKVKTSEINDLNSIKSLIKYFK